MKIIKDNQIFFYQILRNNRNPKSLSLSCSQYCHCHVLSILVTLNILVKIQSELDLKASYLTKLVT